MVLLPRRQTDWKERWVQVWAGAGEGVEMMLWSNLVSDCLFFYKYMLFCSHEELNPKLEGQEERERCQWSKSIKTLIKK